MFGELTIMNSECDLSFDPDRLDLLHEMLLGENAKDVPILAHDFLSKAHLSCEVRVSRSKPQSIRRFRYVDGIAFANTQTSQNFFRQDHPSRVSDFYDLQRVHTGVITRKPSEISLKYRLLFPLGFSRARPHLTLTSKDRL